MEQEEREVSKMVIILVALTFIVAILAKVTIQLPAQKRVSARVEPEREWMVISPAAMVPNGMRA